MTELKLQTLIDRGACQPKADLFRARFGESVDITPELCESVASDFDFEWAAENLLTAPALAEYKRVSDAAVAEYKRVTAPARAEYERVRAPACAEYERVTDAAYAECDRAIAREFARQYIAHGGAQ